MKTISWRVALLGLFILLLVVPVYAQETTPAVEPTVAADEQPLAGVAEETSTETANGLPVLVLVLGVGAIGAVSAITILRENYKPVEETT